MSYAKGEADLPVYPEDIGRYKRESVVIGLDKKHYQCQVPGWSNDASDFYAPGGNIPDYFHNAWQDAE